MNRIQAPALWATTLGPLATFIGYTVAALMWPGYDGYTHTISDLAAGDSPVKWLMDSVFIFSAFCDFVVAHYARAFDIKGRIAIGIAGLSTIGLTVFNTPTQDTHSVPHRIFAITSFAVFSIWPLLAMRKGDGVPPLLRRRFSIWGTVFLCSVSIWFLSLWADKHSDIMGFGERIGVGVQGLYAAVVIWHSWYWQRKHK